MYVLFQDSYKACEDDPVLVADLVDQHYWLGKGKVAGRMGEMFDSFKPILEQGIKRDPEIDQRTLYNELANACYHSFLVISQVVPKLSELFDEAEVAGLLGPNLVEVLFTYMHLGRSEARNADVSTIKAGVYSWPAEIEWDPPTPLVRTAGGHKHPVCSKLLSPPNFTKREMREVQTGKIILMSDDLPRFLWAGCVRQVGRGQTFTGFLRGELLIAGYCAIHISPGAAKGDARSTRGGNAALHDIAFVTIEAIAYIAVLVHFALSDQINFSVGNAADGHFPYNNFYRAIIDMTKRMLAEDREVLLEWWNQRIFPGARGSLKPRATQRKTVVDEMEEELAAERAALGTPPSEHDGLSPEREGSQAAEQPSADNSSVLHVPEVSSGETRRAATAEGV
ncbi:hypothetical protein C8Q72DRAFT_840527 [Fomitopsis betulina]|nr:hypothetical protein C8Q72DRAFT_840527 [Fomitopsis betulina]